MFEQDIRNTGAEAYSVAIERLDPFEGAEIGRTLGDRRLGPPEPALCEREGNVMEVSSSSLWKRTPRRSLTTSARALSRSQDSARWGRSALPPPSGEPRKSRRIKVSKTE